MKGKTDLLDEFRASSANQGESFQEFFLR
jgi:hypothetical protein